MGRGKSQVRQIIPKGMKNEEWYSMFMQLLGSEVDISIVYPKYTEIYELCTKLITNFRKFSTADGFLLKVFPELDKAMREIRFFCDEFEKFLGKHITCEEMTDEGPKNNSYLKLKQSNYIKNLIILTKNIQEHIRYIEDENKIETDLAYCERFIKIYPGIEMTLFPFSSFELKEIWRETHMTNKIKQYILICLIRFYRRAKKIIDLTLSADVNVKGFSSAVAGRLDLAKKQIRGCDKAFGKISNSLDMLETNFDKYYRDVIRSHNPNLLVENFVMDVAKNQEYDKKTTHQFKRIMLYYKKMTQNKINDPKLKRLFDLLGKNISLLEGDDNDSDDDDKFDDDSDNENDAGDDNENDAGDDNENDAGDDNENEAGDDNEGDNNNNDDSNENDTVDNEGENDADDAAADDLYMNALLNKIRGNDDNKDDDSESNGDEGKSPGGYVT